VSHPMHTVFPEPVVYPPGAHVIHISWVGALDAVANFPAPHCVQVDPPPVAYVPAMQEMHAVDDTAPSCVLMVP
jgi:hypothetical protein